MYTTDDINAIPERMENGQLSSREAINIIWTHVYTTPHNYGLRKLSEDELSEFLIFVQSNLEITLKKFNSQTASFRTYLSACVYHLFLNWKKNQKNTYLCDELLFSCYLENYEQVCDNYDRANAESFINNQRKQKQPAVAPKISKSKKQAVLVLALRTYPFLNDCFIEKIADYTEKPVSDILNIIQAINKKQNEKQKRGELLSKKRDFMFSLHLRCEYRFYFESSRYKKKILQKQDRMYIQRWKSLNKKLAAKTFHSPTIHDIAETLGIPERNVYYYIRRTFKKYRAIDEEV